MYFPIILHPGFLQFHLLADHRGLCVIGISFGIILEVVMPIYSFSPVSYFFAHLEHITNLKGLPLSQPYPWVSKCGSK